jgi:hypothetical protein
VEERWLFPGKRPGKPMTTRQLNRLFHEAADVDAAAGNQLKATTRSLPTITCCPPAPGGHLTTGRRSLVISPALKNLFSDQAGASAKFQLAY